MRCWLSFSVFLVCTILVQVTSYRIVCYYADWAMYRAGSGKFGASDINADLCTHYIYAFAGLNSTADVLIDDEFSDIENHGFSDFNEMHDTNPDIVTMIGIGGGDAGNETFAEIVMDVDLRNIFVDNIMNFITTYGFQGADIDWEFPIAEQKDAFVEFLRLLRARFDENGYILSAAVSGDSGTAEDAYDIPAISQYLDFFNVMTYDMHGSWESTTGENSPLYAGPSDPTVYSRTQNVNYMMNYYINNGAPPEKLNLGFGIYGRSFTLSDPSVNGVGAPISGPGTSGPYTGGEGSLNYNEICMMIGEGQLTEYWNGDQFSAYATQGDQWVGYDNIRAVGYKVQFIKDHGIGGAMVWTIDMDDFNNTCGGGNYPIMNTIKSNLN